MPDAPRELLRFDFALGADADPRDIDLRMEVIKDALKADHRWTDVRVTHVGSSDPNLCYVLVWVRRTGRDALEDLRSDVMRTVGEILPNARLSFGPGT